MGGAAIVEREDRVGIEPYRLIEIGDGVVVLTFFRVSDAAVVEYPRQVFSELMTRFDRGRAAVDSQIRREGVIFVQAPIELLLGLSKDRRQRQDHDGNECGCECDE